MERTLVLIKPDITKRKLEDKIISMYAMNGFHIVHHKRVRPTVEILEKHYSAHREKDFYPALLEFMTSDDVIVLVLEGDDIINKVRELHGATNPEKAAEGTIRKLYGTSPTYNAVHASDSLLSANYEINLWSKIAGFGK